MENRVALISGASGGIGACIAQLLTQRGWSLSLGARDPDALAQRFPDAHVVRHDATACDEAEWVAAARARFGRIDAVICSAGVTSPHDVIEIEDDALERMWEINVKSPAASRVRPGPIFAPAGRAASSCWYPCRASVSAPPPAPLTP